MKMQQQITNGKEIGRQRQIQLFQVARKREFSMIWILPVDDIHLLTLSPFDPHGVQSVDLGKAAWRQMEFFENCKIP
jgi:hypothetical protein